MSKNGPGKYTPVPGRPGWIWTEPVPRDGRYVMDVKLQGKGKGFSVESYSINESRMRALRFIDRYNEVE